MKFFLTRSWVELQFKNFAKEISEFFVKKDELKKYEPMEADIYKISVDEYGNVSSATPVTKQDLMDFGIITEYEFFLGNDGHLYYESK